MWRKVYSRSEYLWISLQRGVNLVWSFNSKRLIFIILYNDLIGYFTVCFKYQLNTIHYVKKQLNVREFQIRAVLWRTFISTLFGTISQEPQDLQRFNCSCGVIIKSTVIKYYQSSINRKSHWTSYQQLSTQPFKVSINLLFFLW